MKEKLPSHPQVKMNITQRMIWPPLVDGIVMKLECIAVVKNHNSLNFSDMRWTGIGLQSSLWVTQSELTIAKNQINRSLEFRPWLSSHAGEYTCHLVMNGTDNSTFVMNKTMKIEGK